MARPDWRGFAFVALFVSACGGGSGGSSDAAQDGVSEAGDLASSDMAPSDALVDLGGSCDDNGDCSAMLYCAFAVGVCGPPGHCALRDAPSCRLRQQCGCDGTMYESSCSRLSAGVSLDDISACDCCYEDADCAGRPTTSRCYGQTLARAGRCKDVPSGDDCWGDRDCAMGETCDDAFVCECGTHCIVPDRLGTCIP